MPAQAEAVRIANGHEQLNGIRQEQMPRDNKTDGTKREGEEQQDGNADDPCCAFYIEAVAYALRRPRATTDANGWQSADFTRLAI